MRLELGSRLRLRGCSVWTEAGAGTLRSGVSVRVMVMVKVKVGVMVKVT